ncbi:MAG TPA: hypothetical protein VH255_03535 [Verrucomicrobiae bacterium]|jgi:lipoate-protein ligase A|nr:hypothetical protein [Verrucomicrobiae bacterium]
MFGAIKHITLSLPTPAQNLACDEALLDACEAAGEGVGILRFWESPEYFVVVGYGNKVADEVNQPACAKMNVPILRRCSGGGTVVQGPGCLNYSLILPFDETGPLRTITGANQFIMERNRAALEALLLKVQGSEFRVEILGHTDLVLITRHSSHANQLKFSGNAQRRRRSFLLFHGTFLLNFDLLLLEKLLRMPTKEPDYREHRAHSEFVTNLNVSAEAVKQAMQSAWETKTVLKEIPQDQITTLALEKYSTDKWNLKF